MEVTIDISSWFSSWQFWAAIMVWVVGHAVHNAVLQWRMKVTESRLKRIEDRLDAD